MSNSLKFNGIYKPSNALIIYRHQTGSMYIEEHKIKNNQIGPGQPLQQSTLNKIGNEFHKLKMHVIGGEIPSNLIYSGIKDLNQTIIWTSEPCIRNLKFTDMSIQNGKYPIPALLWIYKQGSLYVLHIDKKKNLFYTPFPNVNNNGNVCMGSAKQFIAHNKIITFKQCILVCENAFFESQFTHYSFDKCVKGNVVDIMNKHLNKPTFDTKCLNPIKQKINSFYD